MSRKVHPTQYPSADVLPNNHVIFGSKGNHYRVIVKIHYNAGLDYIRFIGTHKEYDKIDPNFIKSEAEHEQPWPMWKP